MTDKTASAGAKADTLEALMPPVHRKRTIINLLLWGVLFALLAWSWDGADMRPADLVRDAGNTAAFASGFFPPDFFEWRLYLSEMLVTVGIAVWGTFLTVVCAIPLGILSSENVVPIWVYQPVRRLMDAFRAINEMVFAMLFLVAVGLGPFAGVLALWISFSLYRFESNVRSATVLGIVGAGGIGMLLWEYIRGFCYAETSAVLIIIIASVSLLDIVSQRLRKMFI